MNAFSPALLSLLREDPLAVKRMLEEELSARKLDKLHAFTRFAWDVIEPATPFVDGWHLQAISEHLEACYRREIRNLIINMPPRHMKSISVAVAFPAWAWTKAPHERFLFASYSGALSIRDSLKCRRLIQSPWYQGRWGDSVALVGDQNAKQRFENRSSGYRIATSVGGSMTGEGGDFIVIDDPHNVIDIESATSRQTVLDWWDQSISTRFNDPKTGVRIIVMQRLHASDLTGHILAKETGWDHLILPAEYEKTTRTTSIGWRDPRAVEGELLWPTRFGATEINELKTKLGTYGAAGQLQQRPAPREGGMVKLAWFDDRYETLPSSFVRIVQSWDTAKKKEELHDPSVCTTWLDDGRDFYIVDVYRAKLEYPDLKRAAISKYEQAVERFGSCAGVLIEDAASGTSLIQDLKRETAIPVIARTTKGQAKEVRLAAVTPTMESGRVKLPRSAPWLADYELELTTFPSAPNDDQVDSSTQFLNWAREPVDIFVG